MLPSRDTNDDTMASDSQPAAATPAATPLSSDDEEEFEDVKNCISYDEYFDFVLYQSVAEKTDDCPICISPMELGDAQHVLVCGHGFCPECIRSY